MDPAGRLGSDALTPVPRGALASMPKTRIIEKSGGSMHQAANVQFERAVREFARWCAIPEQARSPAPAWWWGPAFEVLDVQLPMPAAWCASLKLPGGATYADGAEVFLKSLAGQTSLPWPGEFPRKAEHSDVPGVG
jgi:hypothetical protein